MIASLALTVALAGGQMKWAEAPAILSRLEWGAKPALTGAKPHTVSRITIHHAGVATDRRRPFAEKLRALQAFSQREDRLASGQTKPAWPDIPYHYYIDHLGAIAACRDPAFSGDTNTEYDPTGHLLVCLEGNFQVEEPTGAQIRSLNRFVAWAADRYRISAGAIQTHKDFSQQTDCPGKNLYGEVVRIRSRIELLRVCTSGH